MHIAMLAPRLLWPERSGGEIRVASLLRHLAGRHRFTVLFFGKPEDRIATEAAAAFVESRTRARALIAWRTAGHAPPADLPWFVRDYHDPAMTRALQALAARDPLDLVHVEFTQMAQYAVPASRLAPVVMTEHDSSVLSASDSYFAGGPREGEKAAVEKHLRAAFAACRRVVVVSQADADRLAPLASASKFAVVPTGVDLERFPFAPIEGRDEGTAAFVGHYPHHPNEEAAVRLCREILPLMPKSVRVRLIGSSPTPAVTALASERVQVVGTVDDVSPHLRRARAFLAPMKLGYGIKGKILEAFASGTPVVASPRACEAMPGLVEDRHLLLGRDAAEFAAAAARLLSDETLSRRLALAAREYVEKRFGWPAQADLLDAVYREAAAKGARA